MRIHLHTAWQAFSVRGIENRVQNGAEKVLIVVVITNVKEIFESVSQAAGIEIKPERTPCRF